MNLRRALLSLLTAALVTAGLTLSAGSPAGASCAPRMFVVAGFTNGGVAELAANPPVGYQVQVINYPNAWWNWDFQYNVNVGRDVLNFEVNRYYDNCGNPPSVIAGFSLGAIVAGDVLQTQPAYRNIQGILFADARRLPAFPGDPGGLESLLPWAVPGNGLRGFQNPTLTICRWDDPICYASPNVPGYFTHHPAYNGFNVRFELGLHGWGNYKNILW